MKGLKNFFTQKNKPAKTITATSTKIKKFLFYGLVASFGLLVLSKSVKT